MFGDHSRILDANNFDTQLIAEKEYSKELIISVINILYEF